MRVEDEVTSANKGTHSLADVPVASTIRGAQPTTRSNDLFSALVVVSAPLLPASADSKVNMAGAVNE